MDSWVLDTNVVISGLLSPHGPPGRLVDALLARRLVITYDDRILHEYREVMARAKFRFDVEKVNAFLRIMAFQLPVSAFSVKGLKASDPNVTMFLEVAAASEGKTLVTGNIKHFPPAGRKAVRVLSPVEAWAEFAR
ncbi:MAG: putative toxin-antitoxin system toxin component, PIN family [Terrimicrobiaceae bacterium]